MGCRHCQEHPRALQSSRTFLSQHREQHPAPPASLHHGCSAELTLHPDLSQLPPHQKPESPPAGHLQAAPSLQEGRKELFHTLSPSVTRSWHRVLGVSHPLLVSHPSSVPTAASLPLAHSCYRGSAAPWSRAGRRLLTRLEQSTTLQKGTGFARKALRSHKCLEKARKIPILPKFLFPHRGHWLGHCCAGLDRHTKHTQALPRPQL